MNFSNYHKANPQVFSEFVKFAFEAKRKGYKKYSAKGIFELIRWHTKVSGHDGYKLNNNYHADYARLTMQRFPELNGFFITRRLISKKRQNI